MWSSFLFDSWPFSIIQFFVSLCGSGMDRILSLFWFLGKKKDDTHLLSIQNTPRVLIHSFSLSLLCVRVRFQHTHTHTHLTQKHTWSLLFCFFLTLPFVLWLVCVDIDSDLNSRVVTLFERFVNRKTVTHTSLVFDMANRCVGVWVWCDIQEWMANSLTVQIPLLYFSECVNQRKHSSVARSCRNCLRMSINLSVCIPFRNEGLSLAYHNLIDLIDLFININIFQLSPNPVPEQKRHFEYIWTCTHTHTHTVRHADLT